MNPFLVITMELSEFIQLYLNASDDVKHQFEELLIKLEEQSVSREEDS